MPQSQIILEQVRHELKALANPTAIKSHQQFSKEQVKAHGVKTPVVKGLAQKRGKELKTVPKKTVFHLCEKLWQSGYIEESIIACQWAYGQRKKFEPADFAVFERWIEKYVNNWASCDTLCNHTVGEFLMQYPAFVSDVKGWAKAGNRWTRRAAAVSLIIPARKGMFLDAVFAIARLQLTDGDDLVQKGYGWLLKVAADRHQKEVFDFVMQHKSSMPRTALRYAIEKMPPERKTQAMAK